MSYICNNCGRGYEHESPDFVCEVCGARNCADGSVSYDGSHEAVEEMKARCAEYDEKFPV